jgi:hypothetical protein
MSIKNTDELRVRIRIRNTPINASVVEYLSQALEAKQLTQVVVTAVKVLMALENTEMLKKMFVNDPVLNTQLTDTKKEAPGIIPSKQIKVIESEEHPTQQAQVTKPILEAVGQTKDAQVKESHSKPELGEDSKEDDSGEKEGAGGTFKTTLSML